MFYTEESPAVVMLMSMPVTVDRLDENFVRSVVNKDTLRQILQQKINSYARRFRSGG